MLQWPASLKHAAGSCYVISSNRWLVLETFSVASPVPTKAKSWGVISLLWGYYSTLWYILPCR